MVLENKTKINEETINLANGEIIDIETEKTPFYDKNGNIEGIIGISRDITKRNEIDKKLREKEQATQNMLKLATKVQRDMLPEPIDIAELRVDTIFVPYQAVSGDLFNFKWFEGQKKLRGYIVDVTGHGVATALQTATLKMLLDNMLLTKDKMEGNVFQIINFRVKKYLYEDSFAALMYFEFDFESMELKLTCCGINYFVKVTSKEQGLIPIQGCYLGITDEPVIGYMTTPFEAGDMFFLCSDGVSDIIKKRGLSDQLNFEKYMHWLRELTKSSDTTDDFSAVCVKIQTQKWQTQVVNIESYEKIKENRAIIREYLKQKAPDSAGKIEVVVNEAINNGLCSGGRALVKLSFYGNRIIGRVKDDGPGFKFCKSNDELKKDENGEALIQDHGRGIMIMKALCDRVIYNAKGNEVLFMKKI